MGRLVGRTDRKADLDRFEQTYERAWLKCQNGSAMRRGEDGVAAGAGVSGPTTRAEGRSIDPGALSMNVHRIRIRPGVRFALNPGATDRV